MRTISFMASVAAICSIFACTPRGDGPVIQAHHEPTGRNQWIVFCKDMKDATSHYSYPFSGSYLQAMSSGLCDSHGGVMYAWDAGQSAWGEVPNVSILVPAVLEDEETPGGTRTVRPEWASATCAAAVCADSSRNRYDVVYLDRSEARRDRLNCNQVGLANPTGRDVPARRLDRRPAQCSMGIRQR